jgi:hypothetical protein
MSDTISFTGVVLKSFSRNQNGGKANFSATFSPKVGKAMGWAGFPDGATSISLEGALAASSAELQPTDGALAKWVMVIQASGVKQFEAIRYEMEGKRGKGYRYELHFVMEFKDMTACARLEEFITNVGDHKATLTVSYTKAAEQLEIGDVEQTEDRRQSTLAEND